MAENSKYQLNFRLRKKSDLIVLHLNVFGNEKLVLAMGLNRCSLPEAVAFQVSRTLRYISIDMDFICVDQFEY